MRRVVNRLLLLSFLSGVFLFTTPVFTSGPVISNDLGLGATAGSSKAGGENLQNKVSSSIPELLGNIIGIVLGFLGVVFFLLTLYAGFTWMLAHGNETYTKQAKDTLISAAIGLLIVFGSYAITQFVFDALVEDTPPATQNNANPELPAYAQCNQSEYNRCLGGCAFVDCSRENCEGNYEPVNLDQACVLICAESTQCEILLRQ